MSLSIKGKLIRALEALDRKELSGLIRSLKKRNLAGEPDIGMTLTTIIILEVITPNKSILRDPRSELLRQFSKEEVPLAKPKTIPQLSSRETRLARLFFGPDLPTMEAEKTPAKTRRHK